MGVSNPARCRDCLYYYDDGGRNMLCRRFPAWVQRNPFDWCGEFNARAEVTHDNR